MASEAAQKYSQDRFVGMHVDDDLSLAVAILEVQDAYDTGVQHGVERRSIELATTQAAYLELEAYAQSLKLARYGNTQRGWGDNGPY